MHLYQKLICIFLTGYMLMLGIHVAGIQGDSFFIFSEEEKQSETIGRLGNNVDPVCYVLKQYSNSYEENQDEIIHLKNKKLYIGQYMICPDNILHTNLFLAFQKADTRLCQPNRLTNAFTILFIHHQDGLKRRIPFF